jgi:sec-independent protein translocase protein TatB
MQIRGAPVFGLSFEKIVVVAAIAAFVVGPSRLPAYAALLAKWTRNVRSAAEGAKTRFTDELGPEFEDVDWKKLDPRQYDPRTIIYDALMSEPEPEPEPDRPESSLS